MNETLLDTDIATVWAMDADLTTSSGPDAGIPGITHSTPPTQRILIVEDDPILLGLYGGILELDGYEVEMAENGMEALQALAAHACDLVITDCCMPRLDGIGLVRALRQAGCHVPVVMISGSLKLRPLPPDVRGEIAAALPKPVSLDDILNVVSSTLDHFAPNQPAHDFS
jgi:two-component system, OmpR family, response regulator MprA